MNTNDHDEHDERFDIGVGRRQPCDERGWPRHRAKARVARRERTRSRRRSRSKGGRS